MFKEKVDKCYKLKAQPSSSSIDLRQDIHDSLQQFGTTKYNLYEIPNALNITDFIETSAYVFAPSDYSTQTFLAFQKGGTSLCLIAVITVQATMATNIDFRNLKELRTEIKTKIEEYFPVNGISYSNIIQNRPNIFSTISKILQKGFDGFKTTHTSEYVDYTSTFFHITCDKKTPNGIWTIAGHTIKSLFENTVPAQQIKLLF